MHLAHLPPPALRPLLQDAVSKDRLQKETVASLTGVLAQLNPEVHGLGYVHVALALGKGGKAGGSEATEAADALLHAGETLFAHGDAASLAADRAALARLIVLVAETSLLRSRAHAAVRPLLAGLRLLEADASGDAHGLVLTVAHPVVVKVAVLAKEYFAVRPVIERTIVGVQSTSGLSSSDVLSYLYYAGIAYTGMREYRRAMEMHRLCFTAPAACVSAIMVEAHKKFLLLSLLEHASVEQLPSYTSAVIQRELDDLHMAYRELMAAFLRDDADGVQRVMDDSAEQFLADGNMGLVKQLLPSLLRRQVARLTATFLTLSLADIAEKAGLESPEAAERLVLAMIKDGQLSARINQAKNVVEFVSDTSRYAASNRLIVDLTNRIDQVNTLASRVDTIVESLQDAAFEIKARKSAKRPPASADMPSTTGGDDDPPADEMEMD